MKASICRSPALAIFQQYLVYLPLIQSLDLLDLLLVERDLSVMLVLGERLVHGENETVDVVPARHLLGTSNARVSVKVEDLEGARNGLDEDIPMRNVLVHDSEAKIQIVDGISELLHSAKVEWLTVVCLKSASGDVLRGKPEDLSGNIVDYSAVERNKGAVATERFGDLQLVPDVLGALLENGIFECKNLVLVL